MFDFTLQMYNNYLYHTTKIEYFFIKWQKVS